MMKFILALMAVLALPHPASAECALDASVLGARYASTIHARHAANHQHAGDRADNITRTMTLWRNGKRVAHEFPQAQITEIWSRLPNGYLNVTRHFDGYQRGIEYQPLELNRGKGDKDWRLKYQLVSDTLKHKMHLVDTEGEGCEKVEHYELTDAGATHRLAWLPAPRLVKSYIVERKERTENWSLESVVTDAEQVKQAFARRDGYDTTDYADIGDNESDPFLLKLVNLGFVHHASGFYDVNGKPIDDGHGHAH